MNNASQLTMHDVFYMLYLKHPAEDSSRKGCEALFSFKAHEKKLQSQAHMKITRLSRKNPPMGIAYMDHSDIDSPPFECFTYFADSD